jgi:hypothetical protein
MQLLETVKLMAKQLAGYYILTAIVTIVQENQDKIEMKSGLTVHSTQN